MNRPRSIVSGHSETIPASLYLSDREYDCNVIAWYDDDVCGPTVQSTWLVLDAEWFAQFAADVVAEKRIDIRLHAPTAILVRAVLSLESLRVHDGQVDLEKSDTEADVVSWLLQRDIAA